nr:hypothetical protein [Mycobacterium leprae]
MSHAFCASCNLALLTADNQIRSCFFLESGDRPS